MEDVVEQRMRIIQLLAESDTEYNNMLREIEILEKKYDLVLRTLPNDAQDVVCDFVSQCEEMSWRMLELACTHMRFP